MMQHFCEIVLVSPVLTYHTIHTTALEFLPHIIMLGGIPIHHAAVDVCASGLVQVLEVFDTPKLSGILLEDPVNVAHYHSV
jgi:hypothetical protein